jgi:hypothetical protein
MHSRSRTKISRTARNDSCRASVEGRACAARHCGRPVTPMQSSLIAVLLVGLALCGAARIASAATRPGDDPDWPCQQRLVPTLAAGVFWSGPSLEGIGIWRDEPKVAELVRRISPRRVPVDEGETAIFSFADSLPVGDERNRLLTLTFAGLLEETNHDRAELVVLIKQFGRRQRELAEAAASMLDELRAIPVDASGEAGALRGDLEQRLAFATRAFEGAQRTVRYVCDAPVLVEARLGRYARALQARLS